MFLSIIIPTWNDEKFLAECLDSCLTQDIPYDDYEIICVDDGSTDSTPEILADYASRYPNISVINKEHSGGGGRNVGLRAATGDYIWLVDHDDIIKNNVLNQIRGTAYNTDADRITFSCYTFNESLTIEEQKAIEENTLKPNSDRLIDAVVWACVVKRKFLTDHEILPRSKRLENKQAGMGVDTFFVYECKKYGAKTVSMEGIPFYFYRGHRNSQIHNTTVEGQHKFFDSCFNLGMLVKEDYETGNIGCFDEAFMADHTLMWIRESIRHAAIMPREIYKNDIKRMKEAGLFPYSRPQICEFTCRDCIKMDNGKGPIKSMLYFYSPTWLGLKLYRLSNAKMLISRMMRKNKLLNKLLDIKNKLRGK